MCRNHLKMKIFILFFIFIHIFYFLFIVGFFLIPIMLNFNAIDICRILYTLKV